MDIGQQLLVLKIFKFGFKISPKRGSKLPASHAIAFQRSSQRVVTARPRRAVPRGTTRPVQCCWQCSSATRPDGSPHCPTLCRCHLIPWPRISLGQPPQHAHARPCHPPCAPPPCRAMPSANAAWPMPLVRRQLGLPCLATPRARQREGIPP